ncbi:MAG: DUF4214 domain-containing protein, partial [Bryobacteraceae bacterium]
DPDFAGWLFWLVSLNNGTPRQTVVDSFINSQEFQTTYGSLNNTAFVNLVYQNVLGRTHDAAGLNFWTGQLNAGVTRAAMMYSFVVSAEFQSYIQSRALATLLYMGFLRRSLNRRGSPSGSTRSTTASRGQAPSSPLSAVRSTCCAFDCGRDDILLR